MRSAQPDLAYLLRGHVSPELEAAIAAGMHPVPEYAAFLRRNRATALTYGDIERSQRWWPKLCYRRGLAPWALGALALADADRYRGIITTGEDVGLPLVVQALARRQRVPLYVITHGSYFASPKLRVLMAVCRRMKNVHYLCLSETLRRFMVDRLHVPDAQVHNTSYGVDTDFFQPATCAGDSAGPSAVVVSAGTANRDYRTLIAASAGLRVSLKIAADSAWFPAHLDVAPSDVPAHVEIRSYGNYQNLRRLYASAQFVVVPLYPAKHACGYAVVAEAMAMGKPVITTMTEAHGDFVVHGETGFYVRPHDTAELHTRMKYLLDNPEAARQMGERARDRMERLYSVDAYCRRLEQVTK